MSQFYIHEANIERLEKSLKTIQNKCTKYQLDFHYERVGEEIREYENNDGEKVFAKFIIVEVSGEVTHGDWSFVATVDHHEKGNIIRAFNTELEIPEKYKTCGPACEHCNKIRSRKDTYIVYNNTTHEFKQLGKNCMTEYTNGLDAEEAARLVQMYEKLEDGGYYGGSSFTRYMDVKKTLRYAFECFRHFGYEKAYNDEYQTWNKTSTRERVSDYMTLFESPNRLPSTVRERLQSEVDEVHFNPESEYAVQSTEEAMKWIATQDDPNNQYLFSLYIICSEDYQEYRNFGMLVSLPVAYDRHLKDIAYQEKKKAERAADPRMNSQHIGNKGDRLTITCKTFEFVKSFDSEWGMSHLYKFTDENNNVFSWFSSNYIDLDAVEVKTVKGTVKGHSEFQGMKETQMTRCKINA